MTKSNLAAGSSQPQTGRPQSANCQAAVLRPPAGRRRCASADPGLWPAVFRLSGDTSGRGPWTMDVMYLKIHLPGIDRATIGGPCRDRRRRQSGCGVRGALPAARRPIAVRRIPHPPISSSRSRRFFPSAGKQGGKGGRHSTSASRRGSRTCQFPRNDCEGLRSLTAGIQAGPSSRQFRRDE